MDPLSYYKSPPKRVVLGNLNPNGNSPISPMANLKLLTKVATSHFCIEENGEVQGSGEEMEIKSNMNCRRFRSLSYICQKFLLLYHLDIPNGQFKMISLGNLASSLGIEKRRVYDIINVVACLKMAVRLCKDKYKWFGNQNLTQRLTQLKTYAIQKKLDQEIVALLSPTNNNEEIAYKNFDTPRFSVGPDRSDENRIGVLCQKFMMMFLVNQTAINLTDVSKLILSPEQGKTGMRRLYDVANVLETLGLIKRHGKLNKKPTFVYCGPRVGSDVTTGGSDIQNIDYCDSSSESSLDGPGLRKIDSMLEIVCTELEKLEDAPRAKRKLCLDSAEELEETPPAKNPPLFIKAPSESFRFVCNKITQKPPDESENDLVLNKIICVTGPTERNVLPNSLTIPQFKGAASVLTDRKIHNGELSVSKVQQQIKLYRPIKKLFPLNLQGGRTTYRVVKSGNTMKLVKCADKQLTAQS